MDLFTSPFAAILVGGILIGVSLGALTLFTGRVMSMSNMIGSLLGGAEGVAATSIAFIGGLVFAALLAGELGIASAATAEVSAPLLMIGGLLVGIAARAGSVSLGGIMTGLARGTSGSVMLLIVLLTGATAGGLLQIILTGGLGL